MDISNSTILCKEVYNGNIEKVKLLLKKGCNVNAASEPGLNYYWSGETPLHVAIRSRFEVIIKLLLDYNADVNNKDKYGKSVLHKAVIYHKSADVIKRLLENGANLKAKDNNGMMPLNYAVDREYEDMVEALLEKNSDPHDQDHKSIFYLSFVEDEESDIWSEFIRDINFYDDYDYNVYRNFQSYSTERKISKSAAEVFAEHGFTLHFEDLNDVLIPDRLRQCMIKQLNGIEFMLIVQNILNKNEVIDPNNFDRYFLAYKILKGSVQRGLTGIVHNLLTPFVNVHAPLVKGSTLFHEAVIYGHSTTVEELLNYGANVNAIHEGSTMSALHIAVLNEDKNIIRVLLKNNANIEACDNHNQTPLCLAVRRKSKDIVLLLLDAGANSNSLDETGRSPLNIAIGNKSLNIVEALLLNGAVFRAENLHSLFQEVLGFSSRINIFLKLLFDHGAGIFNLNSQQFLDACPHISRVKEFKVKYATFKESNYDFSNDSRMRDMQIKCQSEIEKMKLTIIEGSDLSIHDMLIKSDRQIATYLRNKNIFQILESMDLTKIYPLFGSKLEVHLRKGKIALQLLKIGYHCLESILKLIFPAVVIHKILSFLDDREIRRLIFASSIHNELKESVQNKIEDKNFGESENEDFYDEEIDDFDDEDYTHYLGDEDWV